MIKELENKLAEYDKQLITLKLQKENLANKIKELPRVVTRCKELIGYGYSEAYIQGILYAERTHNIGINDIVEVIANLKKED